MLENIELLAMTKSWDELNSDQQIQIGNTIGKEEYVRLHLHFLEMKKLESPSPELKAKIMGAPRGKKRILPIQFASGVAAALLIGLFSGSFFLSKGDSLQIQVSDRDTVFQKTTDTVYLKQIDTLIQKEVLVKTVAQTKTVYKDRVIEADCEEIPSNLAADYKVPIQEYVVPLPKKKIERSSPNVNVEINNPISDVLTRPR